MRKVLRKRVRRSHDGMSIASDVNAAVVAQTGGQGRASGASSRQRVRIVQRDGRTTVSEQHDTETAPGEST